MAHAAALFSLLLVQAQAARLVRGPYVEGVSARSAFVCWRTDVPTEAALTWRRVARGASWTVEDAAPKLQHCLEAALEAPGRYEYRVRYREPKAEPVWTSTRAFQAVRGPAEPVRFAVLGDSGQATPAQFAVAARLTAARPEFILHVGDVVYPYGGDRDYDDKYFAPYGPLLGGVPVFIAIGNHDYANVKRSGTRGRAWLRDNFLRVHRLPRQRLAGEWVASEPERTYYSFDWGAGHFAAVDVNEAFPVKAAPGIAAGSEQWAWLDADLAASEAPWKLVFLHVPLYSSGSHGSSAFLIEHLAPLFERHGVDVVFQGHDHDYERTAPIAGGERAARGPVYLVVGNGGAALYRQSAHNPWTEVFESRHGFLEVTLSAASLSARAIGEDGREFDRFELKKPARQRKTTGPRRR